jgi:hypothetical protein
MTPSSRSPYSCTARQYSSSRFRTALATVCAFLAAEPILLAQTVLTNAQFYGIGNRLESGTGLTVAENAELVIASGGELRAAPGSIVDLFRATVALPDSLTLKDIAFLGSANEVREGASLSLATGATLVANEGSTVDLTRADVSFPRGVVLTEGPQTLFGKTLESPVISSILSAPATDLQLTAGTGGASLVLGPGSDGNIILSPSGNGTVTINAGLKAAQPAELSALSLFTLLPFTSGSAPFQALLQSYPNEQGGLGTYNHGMFLGFNAGRHTGDTGIMLNRPAILMGFEDNYHDGAGFGTEWYVEHWSPDGTSMQMLRPYYARMRSKDSDNSAEVLMNIGRDQNGFWQVRSGTDILLNVTRLGGMTAYQDLLINSNNLSLDSSLGQATFIMNSPIAPILWFKNGGVSAWALQSHSTDEFVFYDADGRTHMAFTKGTQTDAMTAINSRLAVSGSADVSGHFAAGPRITSRGSATGSGAVLSLIGGRQWDIKANSSAESPPSSLVIRDASFGADRITVDYSGTTSFLSTTDASSSGMGAVVTPGGIYAQKRIISGSDILATGNVNAAGGSYSGGASGLTLNSSIRSTPIAFNLGPTEVARFSPTAGNLLLGGTADIPGTGGLKVFGMAASNSPNSGALQVIGGAGVGGSLNVGGNGLFAGNVLIGGTLDMPGFGGLKVFGSTASASTTTGAFQVIGGAGIGGALNTGSSATFGGRLRILNDYSDVNEVGFYSTSNSIEYGTLGVASTDGALSNNSTARDLVLRSQSALRLTAGGAIDRLVIQPLDGAIAVTSDTDSTSIESGALVVSGGASIQKKTTHGDDVILSPMTATSSMIRLSGTAIADTPGIWFGDVGSPTAANVALSGSSVATSVNGPADGAVNVLLGNVNYLNITSAGVTLQNVPLKVASTTASTSTATGSATFAGGIGVAGRTSTASLNIGAGATVTRILSATATLDFPVIASSGGVQDVVVAVAGATIGSAVNVVEAGGAFAEAGIILRAIVTANGIVTVRATNVTSGTIDPASASYRITVTMF